MNPEAHQSIDEDLDTPDPDEMEPDPEEEATPIVEVSDLTLADLQDGPIPSLGSRSTTPATPSSDATILYSMVEDEAEFPPNTVGQALVFV